MTCSGCGAPRALADRICKSCRLCWETGRKVDVSPPRAAPGRARPLGPPSAASRLRARLFRSEDHLMRLAPLRYALAGVVPGLGHALSGAFRRGALYAAAVPALVLLGTASALGMTFQLLVMALGIALHAHSIFELTPYHRDESARVRVVAILVIQLALALLWWPLVSFMTAGFVAPIIARRGSEAGALGGLTAEVALLAFFVALGIAVTIGLARRLRRTA